MVERIRALADKAVDRALDASRVGATPPDLSAPTSDPSRVLTLMDFPAADELGARSAAKEPACDVVSGCAQLARSREFTDAIAQTFPIERFAEAAARSRSGQANGEAPLNVSAEARAAA